MNKEKLIQVTHPNGYVGILYGERSFVIKDKNGKEMLHTGFRNVNTKEEVYELLGKFPKLLKSLKELK